MGNNKPLVSIALCTFNGEKYIAEQLVSILNQDYSNLEIVIIDDKSNDNTVNILKSFSDKNQNIKLVLNETNIGFNNNFRKALDLCSAEYIAIADQDDVWVENKITRLMENIGDNLLIYHDSAYINNLGEPTNKSTLSHHRFVKGNCAKNLLYYNCVSGHTCLIKKELLTLTAGFPTHFYYDWWLAYTAACRSKITFIIDKLVLHRKHEESSTGKDKTDAKTTRIAHLKLFYNHQETPNNLKNFIQLLLDGYKELDRNHFSSKLFKTLLLNFNSLFYVRKRSLFSICNLILRESKSK
ncbi:glycosyltransferase [Pedobacter lithocola]|uniref:Glycosyltransferase n=1 Tax=Pedobacter lithocola TaxID=1908239 RepID=A0ABV8PD64_9SPHI